MDELRAELDRDWPVSSVQRKDPAADPAPGLEDPEARSGPSEVPGGRKTRGAGADHEDAWPVLVHVRATSAAIPIPPQPFAGRTC